MADLELERRERTPGFKLGLAIAIGVLLAIPIFSVWFLVYDRQSQANEARASIAAGWGGPQALAGPVLVIPYRATASETVVENGQSVTRSRDVIRELTLAPETATLDTAIRPELRKRAIYEAVVYESRVKGAARFVLPPDIARGGIDPARLDLGRAELRFAISDPRGLGPNPRVVIDGAPARLQPGGGSSGGRGFFAFVDATGLPARPLGVEFVFGLRGNEALSLLPQAGDTRWTISSTWPHPSFGGAFLPSNREVRPDGFSASYRIGNLALGRSLATLADAGTSSGVERVAPGRASYASEPAAGDTIQSAQVSLIQPVDPYSQVDRAAKYGFLFIGFTFLALLMFDVVGGVRVAPVEYLLMGAALVLFFVLLLAFAEVIGFTPAYLLAAAAIAGLNTAYSAAVLKSWRRAALIGGLLVGLYAVLYILLSLEAYSLLIGSVMTFAALAGVMYATRRIDWSGRAA
ncbi:MAG: cell envelope integrity protein CreD [Sphingomicrobium sp.]